MHYNSRYTGLRGRHMVSGSPPPLRHSGYCLPTLRVAPITIALRPNAPGLAQCCGALSEISKGDTPTRANGVEHPEPMVSLRIFVKKLCSDPLSPVVERRYFRQGLGLAGALAGLL